MLVAGEESEAQSYPGARFSLRAHTPPPQPPALGTRSGPCPADQGQDAALAPSPTPTL